MPLIEAGLRSPGSLAYWAAAAWMNGPQVTAVSGFMVSVGMPHSAPPDRGQARDDPPRCATGCEIMVALPAGDRAGCRRGWGCRAVRREPVDAVGGAAAGGAFRARGPGRVRRRRAVVAGRGGRGVAAGADRPL